MLLQRISAVALRATIARTLTGDSYRDFSTRLAESSLLQWFCRLGRLGTIRIPGKSQLQRYQEMVEESELRQVVTGLLDSVAENNSALELEEDLDLGTQFLDSTCVKLHIHYPTDWVLLRDATRTLMKATRLIRKRGLKVRMKEPEEFLKRMNRLSMEMTRQARAAEGEEEDPASHEAAGEDHGGPRAAASGLTGETVGGDGAEPSPGAADHRSNRHDPGAAAVGGAPGT